MGGRPPRVAQRRPEGNLDRERLAGLRRDGRASEIASGALSACRCRPQILGVGLMGLLQRIFGQLAAAETRAPEQRDCSWDLIRADFGVGLPFHVSAHFAENLSAVFACVQIISETIATMPLVVYRREGDGKLPSSDHPVARLFSREPNSLQTPV